MRNEMHGRKFDINLYIQLFCAYNVPGTGMSKTEMLSTLMELIF